MRTSHAASLLAATLVLFSHQAPAEVSEFQPAAIKPAERQAVSLALFYLEHGAEAWWGQLSADSPLRALGRDAAQRELEVRLGPSEGATWWLRVSGPRCGSNCAVFEITYPSGMDETIQVELVQEPDWRVHNIYSLVDNPPGLQGFSSSPVSPASSGAGPGVVQALVVLLALATLAAALSATPARALAGAAGILLVALFVSCSSEPVPEKTEDDGANENLLGELLPLRLALTSVGTIGDMALPQDGRVAQVARLWRAQGLLIQGRLEEAEKALAGTDDLPLSFVLKARLALLRSHRQGAVEAYLDAATYGLDHDGLRLEAAQAFEALGLRDDQELTYDELGRMGSRIEETYYAHARQATIAGQVERAENYFKKAWDLKPMRRNELFDDPALSTLCARRSLVKLLDLASVEEPRTGRPQEQRDPMPFPATAELKLSGDFLSVYLGGAELLLPGGGTLAPLNTELETASARQHRLDEAALARFRANPQAAASSALLTSPQHRQQVETAARALAERHRWQELIAVTQGVEGALDRVPKDLVILRALALTRAERDDDAIALLVRLARVEIDGRRRDPVTFYYLGELLAAKGQLELAGRLFERAYDLAPDMVGRGRLDRLEMEMNLARESRTFASRHFHIRVPGVSGRDYPQDLARVLEAEYKRLQRWIPVVSREPIHVDLFPQMEFAHAWGGGVPIAALYDGRIRAPFADLRSLDPNLVTILSHELAHAMVDQAAQEEVPKWLNEGLAQHVEMVQRQINPIPDLPAYRFSHLSLPVLEGILQGFAGFQMVDLAYTQAVWIVHYIEAEHGVAAIHRLIQAYGSGATTDEALQKALGMTLEQFDQAAFLWCLNDAPSLWPTTQLRYDKGEGLSRVDVRLLSDS